MLRGIVRTLIPSARGPQSHVGDSGLKYTFKQLIQRRPEIGSVWIAQAEKSEFILKDIPESYYLNFTEDIWPRIRRNRHQNKYLSHDFLELVRENISHESRRRVLKSILEGLSEMHDCDVVHLDVKPDNVVVDTHTDASGTLVIDAVQLTDFENAVWLKPKRALKGTLVGNDNWRSPEAHLREKLDKSTDMFSFGAVCVYAMLGRVIFGQDEDFDYQVSQGNQPGLIRLQRQTSFFCDEMGYKGLRHHFSTSKDERLLQLLDGMWEDRAAPEIPYKHFSLWPEVQDEDFKDVMLKLMSLDPKSRLTAKQALQHPWFAGVEAIGNAEKSLT